MMKNNTLTLDIWSDMLCPFCFIGKQNLDTALAQFPHREAISIVWHSYQLAPDFVQTKGKNAHEVLAEYKGISVAEAQELNNYVAQMALRSGLTFDMDRMQWANSRQAHRLLQFAKTKGLAEALEQRLFEAVFILGEDIEAPNTLITIAEEIGLSTQEAQKALNETNYENQVQQDIQKGISYGLRGVPFFVANENISFSGALGVTDFLQVLHQVYSEWQNQSDSSLVSGASCDLENNCD